MARENARKRGLEIDYRVMDVCELPLEGPKYDLIVDSYCLQCIVTDEDRGKLFKAVGNRLKPNGYYLISTAMFDPDRFVEARRITDPKTGSTYCEYGDGLMNPRTRIVYERFNREPSECEEALRIEGEWYLPNRRHWKRDELRREVEAAGFRPLYQDEEYGGNLVCIHDQSEESLRDRKRVPPAPHNSGGGL